MTLSATGNAVDTKETVIVDGPTATITSAFYGTDDAGNPIPAPVSEDKKSVTITIIEGLNPLTVNLISEDPAEPPAELSQAGGPPLLFVSFEDNGGEGAIPVLGIKP